MPSMTKKSWLRIALMVSPALVVAVGLLFPWRQQRTRHEVTRWALKDLTLAVKNYQVEYDRYPVPPGSQGDQRLESKGKLLDVLLGEDVDGLNPRKIAYIEPPDFTEGRGGLIRGTGPEGSRLVDRWGHPYVIWLDTDFDNKIANPDVKNSSPLIRRAASPNLILGVIAYSLGPDGVEGTADDIVSWRN